MISDVPTKAFESGRIEFPSRLHSPRPTTMRVLIDLVPRLCAS